MSTSTSRWRGLRPFSGGFLRGTVEQLWQISNSVVGAQDFTLTHVTDIVRRAMSGLDAARKRVQRAERKYTQASAIAAKIQASGERGLAQAIRDEERMRAEYIQA